MLSLPLLSVPDTEGPAADAKVRRIARKFRAVMEELDLDLSDPHLQGTDLRVARAFRELFAGLDAGAEPELRSFPNTERYAAMVTVTDIPFYSLCAHHFLPFFGSAHIAYLPGQRLLGLSKLVRVVEFYARRPQIQERLTEQIVDLLERRLRPAGAMVVVQARHFCIEMRGVSRPGLVTTTSAVRGAFTAERRRREFLTLLPGRAGGSTSIDPGSE
jgi:GTP cyclohydrolase I